MSRGFPVASVRLPRWFEEIERLRRARFVRWFKSATVVDRFYALVMATRRGHNLIRENWIHPSSKAPGGDRLVSRSDIRSCGLHSEATSIGVVSDGKFRCAKGLVGSRTVLDIEWQERVS